MTSFKRWKSGLKSFANIKQPLISLWQTKTDTKGLCIWFCCRYRKTQQGLWTSQVKPVISRPGSSLPSGDINFQLSLDSIKGFCFVFEVTLSSSFWFVRVSLWNVNYLREGWNEANIFLSVCLSVSQKRISDFFFLPSVLKYHDTCLDQLEPKRARVSAVEVMDGAGMGLVTH